MKFQPVEPLRLPDSWTPGKYRVRMLAFHVLQIGEQSVGIELPKRGDNWFLRNNGGGFIARIWDHLIFIESDGEGTWYIDEIRIDAGILSTPVLTYAAFSTGTGKDVGGNWLGEILNHWSPRETLAYRPLRIVNSSGHYNTGNLPIGWRPGGDVVPKAYIYKIPPQRDH